MDDTVKVTVYVVSDEVSGDTYDWYTTREAAAAICEDVPNMYYTAQTVNVPCEILNTAGLDTYLDAVLLDC